MNPWIGKAAFLLGIVVLILIRMPYDKKSKETRVAESRKSTIEKILLGLMTIGGVLLPLLFIVSPVLFPADYPLCQLPLTVGLVCLLFSFWMFYRSHADLGANWSNTLEIREGHQLVASGIYKSIRHPMYVSGLVFALAQALLLANWIAGPGLLIAMLLTVALRIGPEEKMMLEKFGQSYTDYMKATKRYIPGVW